MKGLSSFVLRNFVGVCILSAVNCKLSRRSGFLHLTGCFSVALFHLMASFATQYLFVGKFSFLVCKDLAAHMSNYCCSPALLRLFSLLCAKLVAVFKYHSILNGKCKKQVMQIDKLQVKSCGSK